MATYRLSVVTVSLNAVDIIERTLLSVTAQDYDRLEYIIIDGGSTDGTQAVIEKYRAGITYCVSERDGGIYFGMNKGIDAATGDYLLFLNAGDVFADDRVVSDVASFITQHPDADVVYGDSEQVFEYGSYVIKPKKAYMNHKMGISHQATFVKLELLRSHKFNVRYKYAADFEQLSGFYLDGAGFSYCNRLIARVNMTDGATYRHYTESANEMYDIITSRGVNCSKERKSQIRRKKMTRLFRNMIPQPLWKPVFKIVAKYYKPL